MRPLPLTLMEKMYICIYTLHINYGTLHITYATLHMIYIRLVRCACVLFANGKHVQMAWLRLVGSLKLHVSFAKEPYTRDDILQKRPIFLKEPTHRSHHICVYTLHIEYDTLHIAYANLHMICIIGVRASSSIDAIGKNVHMYTFGHPAH